MSPNGDGNGGRELLALLLNEGWWDWGNIEYTGLIEPANLQLAAQDYDEGTERGSGRDLAPLISVTQSCYM